MTEKLVELDVVPDGEHDMTRHESLLVGLLGFVARELEDLRADVLKCSCQVDRGTATDAVRISALLHEAGNSRDTELEPCLG